METESLIPTVYKKRLPKGFSYAYSAGEISSFLSPLAAYLSCRLFFSARATHWHSKWQKAIRERGKIEVLQCIRQDSGEWDIHVYSVPSEMRQVVRITLKADVFPTLLKWVVTKRGNRFSAYFDLAGESVRIETFP